MARILEVLERHPLFAGVPREALADMVFDCRLRTLLRGDRLFECGEVADAFFLVVAGEVRLSSVTPSGRECVAEILRQGEILALVSAMDGEPHPVAASALTDCSVIRIPRTCFLRLVSHSPELGARTMREVAHWVCRFRTRLDEIRTHTVPARVAAYLLRQAESQTGSSERGAVLELGATREVVAAAVGTVREVFVRAIRGFERQGLLGIQGRRIEILEPSRLRDLAEDLGRRAPPVVFPVRPGPHRRALVPVG
jgi:CRP-like cAMP-binding protein